MGVGALTGVGASAGVAGAATADVSGRAVVTGATLPPHAAWERQMPAIETMTISVRTGTGMVMKELSHRDEGSG